MIFTIYSEKIAHVFTLYWLHVLPHRNTILKQNISQLLKDGSNGITEWIENKVLMMNYNLTLSQIVVQFMKIKKRHNSTRIP